NESKFTLEMAKDHIDEIVDMSHIGIYENDIEITEIERKLNEIIKNMEGEFNLDFDILKKSFDFQEVAKKINIVYELLEEDNSEIESILDRIMILKKMLNVEALINIDIDFKNLFSMNTFDVKFGRMSIKNRKRLNMNYENVTAAVMHLETPYAEDLYLIVYPKELENETERILKSVYFEEIYIDEKFLGKPIEILEAIKAEMKLLKDELNNLYKRMNEMKEIYYKEVYEAFSFIQMQKKIIEFSALIASTQHFFYLSAWIPESKIEFTKNLIEKNGRNAIIEFVDNSKTSAKPPTKLKNNWFSKPFETLVNMYGVPNYYEIDPTMFFSITYMILFGAMFGDLGQGLVFVLAGLYLVKIKKQDIFGGLAMRVGISSMFFGFLYDSFFGYEHIISKIIPLKIYIRPIENINIMLVTAVVLGIVLLFIGFGYSIYNKLKIGDIKEGVFGRNGITGLLLYTSLLIIVLVKLLDSININTLIFVIISIVTVILLIIREPITNKILKKERLYSESASDYYVESGFELLETFLSMLSNTVSFIRVGAFALNHVGLFIAFHTMARLIGSTAGNISMFLLGNIIIILLEGLIVFIQGLRLMYYEIFSKYYTGDGYKFEPSGLE
ncbi:V-type ATPase 116kDa subunit family protein, partial [Clostridiaceae bacterium HSG29]|nr:V-type ATPase 116kDa subunit family protein [Clostridiaceae bacterium HSG29]